MGRFSVRFSIVAAIVALSGAVSANAQLIDPFQNPDTVVVRAGSLSQALPANQYAGNFLPYAIFAVRAYGDNPAHGAPGDEKGYRWGNLKTQIAPDTLKRWTADWRPIGGGDGPLPCIAGEGRCNLISLRGLGYKVWSHEKKNEIVIAFRGTDATQWDDWRSNFRWFNRLLPFNDQYEQVQQHIGRILKTAIARHGQQSPSIVAVGHSLGGGLAQQAAYKDKRIKQVYAFDPTFVTGYYDADVNGRVNSKGLKIDRIYEHGEALAYPRFVLRHFYPASACDPQIRTIRFNLATRGSIIAQHSIVDTTAGFIKLTKNPGVGTRPLPDAPELDRRTGRCKVRSPFTS